MKLHDAIRKGARLTGQTRGEFFDNKTVPVSSCSITAGVIGEIGLNEFLKTKLYVVSNMAIPRRLWPSLDNVAVHPKTGNVGPISSILVELNDVDGWTREEIADWIENDLSRYNWDARPWREVERDYIESLNPEMELV